MLAIAATVPSMAESPVDAMQLVAKATENQLQSKGPSYLFRVRKETPEWSETRIYVETAEGTADLLVAISDSPVGAQQRDREEARLQDLLNNPQALRKKQNEHREESKRVNAVIKALPEAFLYAHEGNERGRNGDEIARLKFRPNPAFRPTGRETQVLTAFQGTMSIDVNRNRIVAIDGTLSRGVSFGWGVFGHLDKGGRLMIEQGDVGAGNWRITRTAVGFTGRVALFKHVNVHYTERSSDFHPVPDGLTFAQGVELLRKQEFGERTDSLDIRFPNFAPAVKTARWLRQIRPDSKF